MNKFNRANYRCQNCKYEWIPIPYIIPKFCPKCKTKYWDVTRSKFMDKVVFKDNGCWEWIGAKLKGYGRYAPDGKNSRLAYRYIYEIINGPIPEGLQLDHLCRNKACVNPDHLEPVTPNENVQRSIWFKRFHLKTRFDK